MQVKFKKSSAGFTLVELLIVLGVTSILAGVSAVVYGNLQVSAQLNDISSQVTQNLRLAREQSLSGLNNIAHGIKFDSNQYTLYQGSSYITRDASYDRTFTFPNSLTLTASLPGQEIIFSKGVGLPNATGTLVFSHSVTGTKTILINELGSIFEQ